MMAQGSVTQPSTHALQRSMRGFALLLLAFLVASHAGGLLRPAVADDPDESRTVAPAAPPNVPDTDAICNALAAAAQENDLPIDFFTRLIWQESRFDPAAVSRAGAQGVAQFMPATASWRGLSDPFDPLEAIPKSAKLLRDLRREFGNLGLAAAAYNAGSGRVRDWLAGRRGLPRETSAYVRIVTGRSPEQWASGKADAGDTRLANTVSCTQTAALVARAPGLAVKPPPDPWGVELVGGPTDATALSAYRRMQEKYASILGGREPLIVHHGLGRGSMGWAHVRAGADSRSAAEKLCANLRAAGVIYCEVQRN
jgi:Transglycosylase SLT domain